MKRRLSYVALLSLLLCISNCTPIKNRAINQYTLSLNHHEARVKNPMPSAILISKPEGMAGYRTEQMLYIQKQYALSPFAKNAWSSPPAEMLYPLLVQRFQNSHAFRAITSSPYADKADYRLDTQLISLHQSFLSKKSTLQFAAKITLTRISDNHVLISKLIQENITCLTNTPYGGVIAANTAANRFVEETLHFVIKQVQADHTKPSSH